MPKESKFAFVPIVNSHSRSNSKASISINRRGTIIFNRMYTEENTMKGKYIKFFADIGKKTLGWQIIDSFNNFSDFKKREYRKITLLKTGLCVISLRTILNELNPKSINYTKLKVGIYVDTIFGKIYYIKLTQKNESDKNN